MPTPFDEQLNRIEGKLDTLLDRMRPARIPMDSPPATTKLPRWAKSHPDEIVQTVIEIKKLWPSPEDGHLQPDHQTPVPGISTSELAARIADIYSQGGDLETCIEISKQAVKEWKQRGKWIKAPQYFFGVSKDAPWRAYYQTHVTNERIINSSRMEVLSGGNEE
jgi:hypothetical protein